MKKDGVFPIKKTYTAYRTDLTITPKLPGLSMKKSLDKKKKKKEVTARGVSKIKGV